MNCKTINELLTAYLDGEVTAEERSQIEAHLSTCEKCREELRALEATRDGLRQALKMKAVDIEPSPQAWNKISQRISEPSIWKKLTSVFNKPAWRAAIPVILVLIIIGALWRTGVLPGLQDGAPVPAPTTTVPRPTLTPSPVPTPTPVPTPAPGPTLYIEAEASLNKDSLFPGEDITIEFSFKNVTLEPFQIDPFPPPVQIGHDGEVLHSFPPGEGGRTLEPDEIVTYTLTWDQSDEQGQQVPYGNYYIKLGDIKLGDRTMSLHLSGTRQFLILPTQGVLEKTIGVNRSETANGIIITLERVELTATSMMVYAFNTPPGYSLPPGQPGPAPSFWINAEAEYSIDGSATKPAGLSGIRFLESGIRHTWDNLDPIPSDAKEMTFRITKLGDWVGPWEFKVPLQ